MKKRTLFVVFMLFSVVVKASDSERASLNSLIFNYWCTSGYPPKSVDDLSKVIDLDLIYKGISFDANEYIKEVDFSKEGELQIIKWSKTEILSNSSKSHRIIRTTNKC